MNTTEITTLDQHIDGYIEALTKSDQARIRKTAEAYAERDGKPVDHYTELFSRETYTYAIMDNARSKYMRLTMSYSGHLSVHAFIDRATGSVYKAAGWTGPAKGKNGKPQERYNLLDDESRALLFDRCEFSGGYLYADRCR